MNPHRISMEIRFFNSNFELGTYNLGELFDPLSSLKVLKL